MVNPDELFNWMVRNCFYYESKTTDEEIEKAANDFISGEDKISLKCFVEYIRPFHIEQEKFEKFVGEKYSFEKHLLPLIKLNLITSHNLYYDDFYGTPEYRKIFDKTTGLVRDYKTEQSFVRFYIEKLEEYS